MRRLIPAALVLAALSVPVLSGQQVIFTPNGILPVLDTYLESLRLQSAIPGMSAAVVKDGQIIWEKGYGFQNVAARIRATPDTPYMVGDMSGTLAAVLALQCVEQRHLTLDAPIGSYGFPAAEPGATLRQILSHTSADPASPEPFLYNPGRYEQLIAAIEWCAPQPYRKSVSHRILNRLAMRDSVPGTDLRDPLLSMPEGLYETEELARYRTTLSRMALPYRIDSRGRQEPIELPAHGMAAMQGLVSTVRDLARLESALDDRLLLLDDTLAAAWNPVTTIRGSAAPTGLGWFVQSYRGQRVVWHFGMIPNAYSSLIVKLPDHRTSLILLANSDRLSSPFQLHTGDVTRSLFATLFLKLIT